MLSAEDLKEIKRLHIQLGRETDSFFVGEYRSAFRGQGMEFEEVRQYVPGDDVRRIDWNVTARMGYPHVKEFREERELTVLLAVDVSASMNLGQKNTICARLAGALAFAAMRNNDRVGLILFGANVLKVIAPQKRDGHAWKIIREVFCQPYQSKGTRFSDLVDIAFQILPNRSVVCVLSDFLAADWREVGRLSHRHRVHGLLIHEALEQKFPFQGLLDIEDSESGRQMLIDTSTVRSADVAMRIQALTGIGVRCSRFSSEEDHIQGLLQHFRMGRLRS